MSRRAIAALALLAAATSARAQILNTGPANIANGSAYVGDVFQNTASGSFINTGSTVTYAGAGAATFTNNGTFSAAAGSAAAVDQFVGPGGAAGPQEIAGSAAPAFYTLTLANGSGQFFTISNTRGVDVANLLALQNGVTTTVNTVAGAIRLGSAATVSGPFSTTRYVRGYVGKAGTAGFTYPLGNVNQGGGNGTAVGATIYSPITLSNPGGTTLSYVAAAPANYTTFATQSAALQLKAVSAHEYYPVSVGAVPSGSTITLPYGNFSASAVGTPYVSDPATLTIAGYDGTRWTNLSATASNTTDATAKTVTVTLPTALSTSYSALALASTSTANPLPVQLVAFTAEKQGPDGLLRWRTASELNSAYFEVQASLDGLVWQNLAQVQAAGSSATARDYRYLDPVPTRYGAPAVYYRLRQVDLDAKTYFSPVVTLSVAAPQWQVTAYPNPFATDLTAQLLTTEAGPVTLLLLDAAGRQVLACTQPGTPGTQLLALDEANHLAAGTYTLLVRQSGHTGTIRVTRR